MIIVVKKIIVMIINVNMENVSEVIMGILAPVMMVGWVIIVMLKMLVLIINVNMVTVSEMNVSYIITYRFTFYTFDFCDNYTDDDTKYTCSCYDGWLGDYCDIADPCYDEKGLSTPVIPLSKRV